MHIYIAISETAGRFDISEGHTPEAAHNSLMIELGGVEPDAVTYWRTSEGLEIDLMSDGCPVSRPNGICSLIDWVPGQEGYPEPEPIPDSPIVRTEIAFDALCDERRMATEHARQLVQAAEVVLVKDVMSRRTVTMSGSDALEQTIPPDATIAILVVELDFDSTEVNWLIALVRNIKGSSEIDWGPIVNE